MTMATTSPMAPRKRKRSASTFVNWSNISVDVLGLIASKITSVEDYLALGAVCRWWRSTSKENLNSIDPMMSQKSSSGWLMQLSNGKEMRLFYSLTRDRSFEIHLPQIAGRECFGAPFGWLFTCKVEIVLPSSGAVHVININLFNPLSKTSIPLPNPILTLKFSHFYICKVILTSPPRSPDCLVIMNYNNGQLAFTRPGDTLWYPILTPDLRWEDFIYFNTNLYACEPNGSLYIFDLSSAKQPNPPAVAAAAAFTPSPWDQDLTIDEASNNNFLVDLGGELCMLIMFTNYDSNATTFEVYKIDMETKDWTRVMSLGNWCLVREGSFDVFSVNVNGNGNGNAAGEGEVWQHKKMSPGCIYWLYQSKYQTFLWNVEKDQCVEQHSDDDDLDIYTRLYPTIRINPSLLP